MINDPQLQMDMCDSVAHQGNLYGDTPLHAACYHGKLECVKRLLHASGTYSLVKVRLCSLLIEHRCPLDGNLSLTCLCNF